MFDHFMRMLDSRSSRMGPTRSLKSVHADYIGGINANFRKWFFAAGTDYDHSVGFANVKVIEKSKEKASMKSPHEAEEKWSYSLSRLPAVDMVVHVAIYLLAWGEAGNLRFMPECMCFIFKCCCDFYSGLDPDEPVKNATPSFLDHAIKPLYTYYKDQLFKKVDGRLVRVDKDHKSIIGYDDMNQLFWYKEGLNRIVLDDERKILDIGAEHRYMYLNQVVWKKAFFKTFKETRSWSHVFCNFNRIWIIHVSMFWYYTSFNAPTFYTYRYNPSLDNQPTVQARLTVMALAGAISAFICLVSILFEWSFIPRKYEGAEPVGKRLVMLFLLTTLNVAPSVYLLVFTPLNSKSTTGILIAVIHFSISVVTVLYLMIVPLGKLFSASMGQGRKYLANDYFIQSFHRLRGTEQAASIGLWLAVFICKFIESYFFLTLSLKDPMRELSIMQMSRCAGDIWIGKSLCAVQPMIVLSLILLTDLVLFFLDTYLWFIVCNTFFSVFRSFYIGISVWTPWRNIFSRLPKRIFSKIIFAPTDGTVKGKYLTSQVWNSIVISMYREHLLSIEHVQKLIYKQIATSTSVEDSMLKEPSFFVSQEDMSMKSTLFYGQSEAQRRITFFAQSLSTPMREIGPTGSMPSFTVLVPHYKEKITLSLREIIREEQQYSNITMLEYLKKLHPLEWSCFIKDTRLLAEEFDTDDSSATRIDEKTDNHYYSVGFKVATPEYILRTRIWASLRTQTLYRTVSGFMNYSRGIKLLFDVETPDDDFIDDAEKLREASAMAIRKFRMIVSMQRFIEFDVDEIENTEFLLRAYPELEIAYLREEEDPTTHETLYFSVLIDGSSPIMPSGFRKPKYKIQLPGNPILGDGKSDNQNHAIIFCRGEYIQLVDANQDNYLEECLKIRSVLEEFEEHSPPLDPYSTQLKTSGYANPVAIIGTREYIFSENIGVLGDVAAGKEQTFGTLFARTLAHIGGKLHYGHPDFLNAIFMNTRGGVSKAQKGLHLNEDVYAGMNVLCRGGRIKHCEYIQCGKGRDLGFGSILNFTTKIGAGMGEQMLSREHFYLSTRLPLDRFLSYYYAHPGFHLNNAFIILSIKLFLIVGVNIAALTRESTICEYDKNVPIRDPHRPVGCYNLIPAVHWLERSILSIYVVFAISFLPLFIQELMERGFYKSFSRLGKHFLCLSPLFEVFVCRVYAESLITDMFIGGARYIATGRGFATTRQPFAVLYSRFAFASLYFGAVSFLLILYTSITMWKIPLLYFWITIVGLLLCPWIYNPNQFSFNEFFLDYRNYLKWLSKGNNSSREISWIQYVRLNRSRITGIKTSKKSFEGFDLKLVNDVKPSKYNTVITSTLLQWIEISFVGIAYLFSNTLNDTRYSNPTPALMRLTIVTLAPIGVNIVILLVFSLVSVFLGPLLSLCCSKFPAMVALTVHSLAIINHLAFFELFWFMQNLDFSRTVLGLATCVLIQRWIFRTFISCFVSREYIHDKANMTWWSGKWFTSGLGWNMFSQPFREFICKLTEMSYFAVDVCMGHCLLFAQFPLLFVPYIDKWHMMLLFWLKPTNQLRPRLFSKKQKRRIRRTVNLYFVVFVMILVLMASLIVVPIVATRYFELEFSDYAPQFIQDLIQPETPFLQRKGLHKGLVRN
ncbi:1,3-beta-glucan synthase component [Yamadazyma tenuis ATCC 10573]|uniref:1,3-beta-glucan synthase n=2 Tax=Candida tenuis TaxID=2315449 RepID=G3BBN7_CANTC|nr:1,3-beta-glucan synthase component [Yamadazyma tenuis ATCC 10573]EGV62195.1 1,3-beta-glucan synthase component [Yamadazyma tenuis ATCC 10573]